MMMIFAALLLLFCINVNGLLNLEFINNKRNRNVVINDKNVISWKLNAWTQLPRIKRNYNSSVYYNPTREAYERAINETINDYYAQRKAVMDRYYARQREIAENFRNKSSTWEHQQSISRPNDVNTMIADRSSNMLPTATLTVEQNPTVIENKRSQNIGNCTHVPDENLLYQHNLKIGLHGSSQLDTNFQVNLDSNISITCVNAEFVDDSKIIVSYVGGGSGSNFIKFSVKGAKNRGIFITIKVWGIQHASK